MSNKFWSKYYGSLVGAEILSFDGIEGNGGGFIFGLKTPEVVAVK